MTINPDKYRGTDIYRYVYTELTLAARYRGTLTYQEVAAMARLPMTGNHMSREVGLLLGEISEDEHLQGRPLLSALVINVEGKVTGGFFTLARLLGLLTSDDPAAEQRFLDQQRKAIYAYWKRPLPEK